MCSGLAEPVEFFHALVRENGSLLRLLDADYTYANEPLARLYGLDGVKGDAFRRVALTRARQLLCAVEVPCPAQRRARASTHAMIDPAGA